MKSIYSIIAPFCYRFFPGLVNSPMATHYLQSKGIQIGKGTVFFNAGSITVDSSRPALLSIGEYCKITGGTIILTHDYSRSVLRRKYGEVLGEARKTSIGNNVFIGMNSILLMGTQIGDNTIIGAGSVLRGSYPPNSVIAGNPAVVICSLDDYYNKRKNKYVSEALDYAVILYQKNKVWPTINEMGAFFPLYLKRDRKALKENKIKTCLSGDNENEIIDHFLKTKPLFNGYIEFINEAMQHSNE